MITCPRCIAIRARLKATALKACGLSAMDVLPVMVQSYGRGFFVDVSKGITLKYTNRFGETSTIKEFDK